MLFVCMALACHATAEIDTRDALVIGAYKVSAYRVEKSYRRSFGLLHPTSPAPDSISIRTWFEQFLIDQVLTAQALATGYGNRPEVVSEVKHMEQHMLTQLAGPYYDYLYNSSSSSSIESAPPSLCEQRTFNLEVLRIPKDAPVAPEVRRLLQLEWSDSHESEWSAVENSGQVEYFSGLARWPFEPFEEIEDTICRAPLGHWRQIEARTTLVVFRIRNAGMPIEPSTARLGPLPVDQREHLARRRIEKIHRDQILQDARLTFDWEAAEYLTKQLIARHPDPLQPLDVKILETVRIGPLATYRDTGTERKIAVVDYINYFTRQYIRHFPRNAYEVYTMAQSMVVGERDERDARRLGIDSEPKFVEDRRNYRDALALDLYVKERVRPALGVTEEDIQRYYTVNRTTFVRPARIEGGLITFRDAEQAVAFLKATDPATKQTTLEHATHRQTLVLSRGEPFPEIGVLPDLAFSPHAPPKIGPLSASGGFVVWISHRTIESETIPLPAASGEIRARLEQPLLQRYEAELARKLCRDLSVSDQIDYKKFGVGEPVVKPWSS